MENELSENGSKPKNNNLSTINTNTTDSFKNIHVCTVHTRIFLNRNKPMLKSRDRFYNN